MTPSTSFLVSVAISIAGIVAARAMRKGGLLPVIARLMLLVACGGFAFAFFVIVAQGAPQLILLGFMALAIGGTSAIRLGGWVHGTARWGTASDAALAGALDGYGFLVGKIKASSVKDAMRELWRAPWWASESVCNLFMAALRRKPVWVTVNRQVNTLVVAGVGRGKTQGLVIPHLLTCPESMVILDPKGELARASAAHRRDEFGHRVYIIDPFGVLQ